MRWYPLLDLVRPHFTTIQVPGTSDKQRPTTKTTRILATEPSPALPLERQQCKMVLGGVGEGKQPPYRGWVEISICNRARTTRV